MEKWEFAFSCISAVSTLLILIQLFCSHRMKKKEHEEQRRQKTVEMMLEWSNSLKRETSFAEKIVEKMNEEQCRKLYSQQSFTVNKDIKNMLCQICSCRDTSECIKCKESKKSEHKIFDKQLSELRWYIISYLNMLETVLVAWQQGTVDREIVEHEFSYLYNSEKGWDVLSHFRKAAGGDKSYPVIEEFCKKLKENEKNKNGIRIKKGL